MVPAVAAVVTALVAGWHTAASIRAADAAAARYGRTASVFVTRNAVRAGDTLSASDVERRRVPLSLLPAAEPAARAAGRVATADLLGGEVVVEERLGTSLVPVDWRAVAVTPPRAGGAHPPLGPGDVVDVVDVGAEQGAVVARDAIVVSVTKDGIVTVAVPSADLAAVAYAAAGGTAVLAVTAPTPRR